MAREHRYRLDLSWTGAGRGSTTSYQAYSREYLIRIEGKPPLMGSADPLFRGDPALPNPEELLIAALSSCHMLSFLAEASRAGLPVLGYDDSTEGLMVFDGGGGQFRSVTLHPRVILPAGSDPELVGKLHERAHQNCFIARSVNFPVDHLATIEYAEA